MKTNTDQNRRRFLMTSAGGAAAAGLAGFAPSALAKGKPLPGYASWKNEANLIVHSSNTMETVRGAQGTSVITANDVLFVRNNLTPPDEAAVKNADAWQVEIQGVTSPRSFTLDSVAAQPRTMQAEIE